MSVSNEDARRAGGAGRVRSGRLGLRLASGGWLLACFGAAYAQASEARGSGQGASPHQGSSGTVTKDSVTIRSKPWLFNRETRYSHSLPEVDGTTITVTKKTSVVKLDEQPTLIDNNQRELFNRLPGLVLAEQQNPTQLNL